MRPPVTRKAFSNVVVALKGTIQETQEIIDDVGATIDGKSHLCLCDLQKQSFASIEKLETERTFHDVEELVKSFQSRKLPLAWFHSAFDLTCRSEDGFITAARTIAKLADLDQAPCTVRDLVVDGRVAEGLAKLLKWGSMKQRWYAAAACAELTKRHYPTNKTIGECLDVVAELVRLLSDAMQCNCGTAKHDAAASLVNLAGEASLLKAFNTTRIEKVAYQVISTQPQEDDWDTTELLLKTLSALAWHSDEVAATMYELGFAELLMTLMKDDVRASKVFKNGVQCEAGYALTRMLEGHNDAAKFFDDNERMAILTDLLLDGERHPELARMGALSVMNALTGLDDLDRAMHYGGLLFKAGVMGACMKIVTSSTSSVLKILKKNASGAVANMCAVYTDCHEPLINSDGIPTFATFATSCDTSDVEKEHALLVLYHLARCGTPNIAQRIATACNGSLIGRLKKHALRDPACAVEVLSNEACANKRVLLEHSVDLMHMIIKRMTEIDASTDEDDAPTTRKRQRAE